MYHNMCPDLSQLLKIQSANQAQLARIYKNNRINFKKYSMKIWFLTLCKRHRITPSFIQIRSSVSTYSADVAVEKAKKVWLQSEIKYFYKLRDKTSSLLYLSHMKLANITDRITFDIFDRKVRDTTEHIGKNLYNKLYKKFINLKNVSKPKVVYGYGLSSEHKFHTRTLNLSSVDFTSNELNLLDKGLKYSVNVKVSQKHLKIAASDTENILQYINKQTAPSLSMRNVVSSFKPQHLSANKRETETLSRISDKILTNDLVIAKADKGNCTVILKKSEYLKKCYQFINENNIELLTINPLNKYQSLLGSTIKRCTELFEYFETKYSYYIQQNPRVPKLYTLPKIHKPTIPHRPIVSFNNSPAHRISKFLNETFQTYLQFKPKFTIRNSTNLCNELASLSVPPNSMLVSFDISNLFPSVPPQECLPLIQKILFKSDLPDWVTQYLFDMLNVTLQQNFFVFNDKFYQQKEGLAMGSPLSPYLADVFLNHLETSQISTNVLFQQHIFKWYRYVDDIFAIFEGTTNDLTAFLLFLNSVHPRIRFTCEMEKDRELPFLDVNIRRNINNSLYFSIYRKDTCTDHLIPADSTHPWEHKLSSFRSLFNRLFSIPLSVNEFQKEIDTIRTIGIKNGYEEKTIYSIYKKVESSYITKNLTKLDSKPDKPLKYFKLHYLPSISYRLRNALKHKSIKISLCTTNTLSSLLPSHKQKYERSSDSGVYCLTCECGHKYIGRTFRSISVRVKEHTTQINPQKLININNLKQRSPFAYHMLTCNKAESIHSYSSKVLHTDCHNPTISNLETIEILCSIRDNPSTTINETVDFPNLHVIRELINLRIIT